MLNPDKLLISKASALWLPICVDLQAFGWDRIVIKKLEVRNLNFRV